MTQSRALADGQARRGRSARRDLHDPGREGRRSQPHQLERLGRARSGVVARRQVRLVLQRRVRRVRALHRIAGRPDAAARDQASDEPAHYYTPSWSPDGSRSCSTTRICKLWVVDVATGQGEGRRQRSVDGADAHDESGVVPGRKVDRVREASQLAVQGDRGRERRDGRDRSRSPTVSPTRCRRRGTRAASICGSSRRPTSGSSRSGST